MSTERQNEGDKRRTSGRSFNVESESGVDKAEIRQGKSFTPKPDEILNEVPESITAGEVLPHVSEYSGLRLEALPLKGLKSFIYSVAAILVVLVGWEIFSVFKSALEIHWIVASAFIILLLLVSWLGLRLLWAYLHDRENLGALRDIQDQAARLSEGHSFGKAGSFVNDLKIFYTDKPQAVYFQHCLEKLPDYNDDREVINYIDRVFLQPLDKEALRRISKFSLQSGVAVAASPWASMDMGLALWRSIKMIDEVAQVYGMRPSLQNRYQLIKQVMHLLVIVGVSEVMIDQLMTEFGSLTLTRMASARLGQGLGASIYTAKIGIAAMKASRPIECSDEPKLKSLIGPFMATMKKGVG